MKCGATGLDRAFIALITSFLLIVISILFLSQKVENSPHVIQEKDVFVPKSDCILSWTKRQGGQCQKKR